MKKLKDFKLKLLFLTLCALVLSAIYVFRFPCPIKALTGVPCPGCGMTHAYLRLLNLDVAGAFAANSAFWVLPSAIVLLVKDGAVFKNKKLNRLFIFALVFSAAASYAAKLLMFFLY